LPPPEAPSVAVAASRQRFPVHRIYCVGRNYADHVREMGGIEGLEVLRNTIAPGPPAD
jgi:fumarylpyruvate hydrolase